MTTYTVVALADGRRVGGQSDATTEDVLNILKDERGTPSKVFWQLKTLEAEGQLTVIDRYKVFPSDERDTVSVLVVYRNQ